jgi:hypothetical protein
MSELEKEAAANGGAEVAASPSKELAPSDDATPSAKDDEEYVEPRMTKAKWLACIALGISYTTAFQQGATVGAIIKSIDEALGARRAPPRLWLLLTARQGRPRTTTGCSAPSPSAHRSRSRCRAVSQTSSGGGGSSWSAA